MSTREARALINSANFPLIYALAGRSILDLNDLNARMPGTFYGTSDSMEFGVPQLLYCENILPYAKGIFSVGYGQQSGDAVPATNLFDHAIVLRDADENLTLFCPAGGANYVYSQAAGTWAQKSPFTFTGDLVTRAYVNGRSFICYEGTKVCEYDAVAGTLNTLTLTLPVGYTMSQIRGIGGASNYLLLFTDLEVLWCSPLNILDFADIDHGSGGQIPNDLRGKITAILPISGGFTVFTARNAVGATYTNQAAGPFVFKEVAGSGGVPSYEQITADLNGVYQYVWSSVGLQRINLQKAEQFNPPMTDFLTGQIWEEWDTVNKKVVTTQIASSYTVKLSHVAGRYLVVSFGQERRKYDAAFIYDEGLERWGKLKIEHADVFMYPYLTSAGDYFYADLPGFYSDLNDNTYSDLDVVRLQVVQPRHGIGFMTMGGAISIMSTTFTQADASGVALFGHFQLNREKMVTVQACNVAGFGHMDVNVLVSLRGTDRTYTTGVYLNEATGTLWQNNLRKTGENVDVAIEGSYVLSDLILEIAQHGSR